MAKWILFEKWTQIPLFLKDNYDQFSMYIKLLAPNDTVMLTCQFQQIFSANIISELCKPQDKLCNDEII